MVGSDPRQMARAAELLTRGGGGLAVVSAAGECVLPLPVAGLMSEDDAAQVAAAKRRIKAAARNLGSQLEDATMTLSFLALPVIPRLKITNRGRVDVEKFAHVDLVVAWGAALPNPAERVSKLLR